MNFTQLDTIQPKFNPTQIANCKIWLAADKITGLNDGDAITTWSDLSGNGNDATQSTASLKPVYKTGIVAGKPVVRFDGTDDYMHIADSASFKTANITVFMVAKSGTNFSIMLNYPHDVTHTDPYFRWSLLHSNTDNLAHRWNGTDHVSGSTFSNSAFNIFELKDNVSSVNGTVFNSDTDADLTYPNAVGIRIGSNIDGGENMNGDIAEIIHYGASLSTGEVNKVRGYLGRKYGIAIV